MRILILNGPNLNLLGRREPDIYGEKDYEETMCAIGEYAERLGFSADIRQTNHEGTLIDWLHEADVEGVRAVLLNAGALTHYSYALHDAITSVNTPVYEIHLSDPEKRKEPFRHHSVIRNACAGTFAGEGADSYKKALDHVRKEWSP